MSEQPVIFSERPCADGRRIAVATLNAEKSLNALSLEMVDLLSAQLDRWEADPGIAALLIDSAGDRAFSAGGDIRRLYDSMVEHGAGENPYARDFFSREYRLDHRLHHSPLPIVTWGNGFVMGGGMGVYQGGAFRVVTEHSRLAMPEIGIGLFPDVGGTWFLNRTRDDCGLFLGLTGAQINAADALYAGLADMFVPHGDKALVLDRLAALSWAEDAGARRAQIDAMLRECERERRDLLPAGQLERHADWMARVTGAGSLAEASAAITAHAGDDPWAQRAVANHRRGCPVSIFLAHELHRRGRGLTLADCLRLELIAALNCAKYGNFREGVRAQIIDRDNAPRFEPATLAELTPELQRQYLTPPWGDAPHPLADL
ncbi:MAG: enoyl-CoA hydratase/isomerase family protein [Pseudomonadota bacterium]